MNQVMSKKNVMNEDVQRLKALFDIFNLSRFQCIDSIKLLTVTSNDPVQEEN